MLRQQTTPAVRYGQPVDAPVVDGFRPPTTPYGPGNRGWEYATVPGAAVVSAGDGTVSFAGQVGPAFAVTVLHADGLRTSYSQLETVLVRAGDEVRRGDPVGRSTDRLHFGVRRGEVHIDPASLFAVVRGRARLVPLRRRPRAWRGASGRPGVPTTQNTDCTARSGYTCPPTSLPEVAGAATRRAAQHPITPVITRTRALPRSSHERRRARGRSTDGKENLTWPS